ncbi:MAG: PQQ-binding-like beta-propeller repeat protein [Planctomycetota bacterium]
MRFAVVMALCGLCAGTLLGADNWPQFLGSHGDGHADTTDLPVSWSETSNVVWKTPIHGRGWSSPVIWGQQIWMGTAKEDGKEFFAVCADKDTGKILHDIKLFESEKPDFCHALNSYASPTPVMEEGRVYMHFGSYGTACLDTTADGKVLWSRKDLPCNHWRGPGSSPILYQDLLIVHYDGYDLQYIVALNKNTGETVWKKTRDVEYGTTDGDVMKAYSTPIVIDVNGQQQLISTTSKAVLAYEPLTGKEIWRVRYDGFSSTARPIYGLGMVFISTGFGKAQVYAIKPDGTGDVTDTHVVWKANKGVPSMPSFVLVGERIYMCSDSGVASCLNALTGATVWQNRLEGQFSASMLFAEGRVYFPSREGTTTVVAAADEYKVLSENKLEDGCMASPAAIGKSLFLRTKTHLYRIENK